MSFEWFKLDNIKRWIISILSLKERFNYQKEEKRKEKKRKEEKKKRERERLFKVNIIKLILVILLIRRFLLDTFSKLSIFRFTLGRIMCYWLLDLFWLHK